MGNFNLIKTVGRARLGSFSTPHGVIQTPVFMNVGTAAAIKGGVSSVDLKKIKCQVMLSNTYHLHIRPGEEIIRMFGGIRKFINWKKPVLTDSGGFQVFSLASLRDISEEGVKFRSHVDGAEVFMSPEISMKIQSSLASTIAMAFDECPSSVADHSYVKTACGRTSRWLARCKAELDNLNQREETLNKNQMLFGINQGGVYSDLRIEHM
ncbi:MAG: tRNA guanosine(34) transglycosylase Tgt, partial [Eubacteriales bacterium]